MHLFPTQVLENSLTALAGKHQIKHDHIVNAMLGEVGAGFSVSGMIHCQSGFAQSSDDVLGKSLLVFDQEHAHDRAT
jgi:hypothetical protein